MLSQKKKFLKTNNITSLLEQKKKDFIPYVFPVVWIHPNSYGNISEKNRFEKITELFLKLRVYLDENSDNELIIAKEFLIRHGIYDKEYLLIDSLTNFINFIKSDDCLKINPSRTLKYIILNACHINTGNNNLMEYEEENLISDDRSMDVNNQENYDNVISENNAFFNNNVRILGNYYSNIKDANNNNNYNENTNIISAEINSQTTDLHNFNLRTHNKFFNHYNISNNLNLNANKPATTQSLKLRNNMNFNSKNNILSPDNRTNPTFHPILNEKIYKIEYNNPKVVIDNLEQEIAKIKGLSINVSQKKIKKKRYEMGINNLKQNKKKLNEEISTSGQLPIKDMEQIKKKNKLLEYIILQRSKNRLKLENDKKVFELEYNEKIINDIEINGNNGSKNDDFRKSHSSNFLKKKFVEEKTKTNFFPKILKQESIKK